MTANQDATFLYKLFLYKRLCFVTSFAVLLLSFLFLFTIPVKSLAATFQVQTGYYMGDGGNNHAITGIGFDPELVMIKDDTSNGILGVVWKSSAMSGETTATTADSVSAITSGAIKSLDYDGFTLGSNVDVNAENVRFTYVAFKGSDCTSTGTFCIGSYVGDGSSSRAITSVGFQPDFVVVKGDLNSAGTFRTSSMSTNVAALFGNTNEISDGTVFKTLDSTGFTIGSGSRVNLLASTYWFYAFKSTTNAFAVGSYTGDGLDGKTITAPGFKPDYVMVKNSSATTPIRAVYNLTESNGDYSSTFSSAVNLQGAIKSLDSTGFTVGTSPTVNESGKTIYWVAFNGAVNPEASGTYTEKVGTFTGTGTAQSITDLGFSPDLVIIKDESAATYAAFRTKLMKGDMTLAYAANTTYYTGGITSIDNDGFSVGTDPSVNSSGSTYHYQAFGNAFNPETNTGAADFSIGVYTGSNGDNRDIVRNPFQPNLVAVKGTSTARGAWKVSSESADAALAFTGVAEAADIIQSLNSDGFQVGTSTRANGNGNLYYYFSFKTSSTFKVGSYSGTGSAQNITSLGFAPSLTWVKSASTDNGVFRPSTILTDLTLWFADIISATDRITALLLDGFSVGSSKNETNVSSNTYYFAGWKSAVVPTPTPTPSVSPYNWFPGYYVLAAANASQADKQQLMDDPLTAPFDGYQFRYNWAESELTPGDFSAGFTKLDADLASVAAKHKKLFVMLMYKKFDGTSTVPLDLQTGPGSWCSGSYCGELIVGDTRIAMLWNSTVETRLNAWVSAMAAHLSASPYISSVAGIILPETSVATTNTTVLAEAGYDPYVYIDAIQSNLLAMTTSAPNLVSFYFHEGGFVSMDGQSVHAGTRMGDWMLQHPRIGTGLPDAMPLNPKTNTHPCANSKYQSFVPCAPSVQAGDYALTKTDSIDATFDYLFNTVPNGLFGSFVSFSYAVGAGPNAFTFEDVSNYIQTHPIPTANATAPWPGVIEYSTDTSTTQTSSTANATSSSSPRSCDDVVPVGTPELFEIRTNTNTATLFFKPISGTNVSYYFIAYGYSLGDNRFGTIMENHGSTGVLKLTINFLDKDTKYYFSLRPGNGCSPGTWSNWLSAKTTKWPFTSKVFYLYNK